MAKAAQKQVKTRFKGPPFQPTLIRQWRKHRGLTLERLADRLDMTIGNLSNIETGKQGYTQGNLEAVAEALQCEVVDLLMRNPLEPESIWTLWERAKPAQREQLVEVAKALLRVA